MVDLSKALLLLALDGLLKRAEYDYGQAIPGAVQTGTAAENFEAAMAAQRAGQAPPQMKALTPAEQQQQQGFAHKQQVLQRSTLPTVRDIRGAPNAPGERVDNRRETLFMKGVRGLSSEVGGAFSEGAMTKAKPTIKEVSKKLEDTKNSIDAAPKALEEAAGRAVKAAPGQLVAGAKEQISDAGTKLWQYLQQQGGQLWDTAQGAWDDPSGAAGKIWDQAKANPGLAALVLALGGGAAYVGGRALFGGGGGNGGGGGGGYDQGYQDAQRQFNRRKYQSGYYGG